ncbi:pyruvate, water dikinase [Actinoplanes bogorensis]|uniref:Pyruvate, water dikinase n=1 Tax=Paractinoplanes bogorensis TaxID=1610840 RepID=A0ABS5YLG7_9ACTN|nr:PEP/pyruvate-binding domain-containing protein [Actinoplanes bogorensis]MBU2664301.1 pyruvate, water dikinase [Actinoplanes bogorensis]
MPVVGLRDVGPGLRAVAGGKAAGLGALLRAGERVPDGFCVTVEGAEPSEIISAYEALGAPAVAVRSSATVEDGPDASFAGMFDTVLDVRGVDDLFAAIRRCRDSAGGARVTAYGKEIDVGMAVVVQPMVDVVTAGVLFTADPVRGTRGRMVVEAAAGTGVVDGTVNVERRVLDRDDPLWVVGERLEALFGGPQDVEWAVDRHGELWILQSRPITTLFPAPPVTGGPPRVYLEFGHVQGMLQPVTPRGMDTLKELVRDMLVPLGLRVEIIDVGGRMYGDMTDLVRDPVARRRLIPLLAVDFGPRAQAVMRHVLDDPRFAPGPRRKRPRGALPPIGRAVRGVAGALLRPEQARRRLDREIDRIRVAAEKPADETPDAILWPIVAGMMAAALPAKLLGDVARPGEIHTVLGGMPHNVTIEMDLALWELAGGADDPADVDLTEFLRAYGHRAAAEVDLGVPRWSEDPAPVRAALAAMVRVTDPEQAPDVRFARAAERAETTLRDLSVRVRRRRPVRGTLAVWLLRRARELAGLRESGKFAGLYRLAAMRRELLAQGAEMAAAGVLEQAGDIMFLTREETDQPLPAVRDLVASRRATHERECRRRSVPVALFSDGTDVEATMPVTAPADALRGVGASAGRATGPVRVVLDPATAHFEPGEVLVTATTDPGWTPLFLTAAALVTETGAVMAHGPTVAREYGLPAVICVPGATRHLRTGQIVTVDAAAGTVVLEGAR